MVEAPEEKGEMSTKTTSGILKYSGEIEASIEIPNGADILIYSKDQSYLTHGIHKFPAKFFPELPRYLIDHYSKKGETVLDPMCGSGTVVLEAYLRSRAAIGIDIDPMARLITKVKTTPIDVSVLEDARDWLLGRLIQSQSDSRYCPEIPEFNYRDNWFRDFVLHELGIIRDAIHQFRESSLSEALPSHSESAVYDFLRVVFSSIIRDVSNADPHCTRTVIRQKLQKKIEPGETVEKFQDTLEQQLKGMRELFAITKDLNLKEPVLPETNATSTGLESESVDLAITSPPYINAVDYPRTHQLEMYWLGLVEDGPLSKMKRRYIGTETVYKKEYAQLRTTGITSLDSLLAKIYDIDPRRSYIVFKFFEDMKQQFIETYRILRPGGCYCVAIGNNLIRGYPVHSHSILTEIATSEEVGFTLTKSFFSGVIRHFIKIPRKERMSGEWVLVLRKP
ncbi:MAG: DNA methyltransferase [Candidatus Thorarchaeota archaeon]|jgi:DNA modification methylase